jgi:hypothetical protein
VTGHAPFTELSNSIIIAPAGTEPVNVTNAQDTRLIMDNVQITAPAAQKVLNVVNGQIVGKRITSDGPAWENAGSIEVTDSRIIGTVTNLPGGTWKGDKSGKGADPTEFRIPTRPVPHPAAGKFPSLNAALAGK